MTTRWRKSGRSGGEGGNCVELGRDELPSPTLVRDSKNPAGPVLTGDVAALVAAVKSGTISA
jgi:hypothetical protein